MHHRHLFVLALAALAACKPDPSRITCPEGAVLHTSRDPSGGSLHSCQRPLEGERALQHGPFVELDAQGRVTRRGEMRDGQPHFVTTFHPNGTRATEGPMKDGLPHGDWTEWSEAGEVMAQNRYDRGRLVAQYGRPVFSYASHGGDTDVVSHLRRAPHTAIARVIDCYETELPRATMPADTLFEVIEPVRGAPGKRVYGHTMVGCPLEVGTITIVSVEPQPGKRTGDIMRSFSSGQDVPRGVMVDGRVLTAIQVPGMDAAREDVRRMKLAP
ncbi:hypothetical protein HPC49_14160 [Pyxidicoccus fallax]|uniref:Lipoprotein n=1 Tax=Pyxidicoccus fallax TaxID=394095 RepID=A0A848LKA4_9BACT|nr:hypothetical protein [Pyxidicoccus fallax]NMO18151.1 hypothetical protein [Pyxidicoccus fallax]NPC79378.1 hypothetical protein [Pyxidicoccus fallax]